MRYNQKELALPGQNARDGEYISFTFKFVRSNYLFCILQKESVFT